MTRTEFLANKQLHPKKPIIGWQVKIGSQVYYESKDYGLAMYYIRTHSLKTTPKAKYS